MTRKVSLAKQNLKQKKMLKSICIHKRRQFWMRKKTKNKQIKIRPVYKIDRCIMILINKLKI